MNILNYSDNVNGTARNGLEGTILLRLLAPDQHRTSYRAVAPIPCGVRRGLALESAVQYSIH